jgi:hypothetical protein
LYIGNEVLDKNLEIEMGLSAVNGQGKGELSVAGDARRDKLKLKLKIKIKPGSGRKKVYLSGCSIFNGNIGKLTLGHRFVSSVQRVWSMTQSLSKTFLGHPKEWKPVVLQG